MHVFLSYRRTDTERIASGIRRYLAERQIGVIPFFYRDSTAAGAEWRKTVDRNLSRCDVLVAIIGPHWAVDQNGERLLDRNEDVVRYELETARRQNKRVIPVLVGGASKPSANQLPESLLWVTGLHEIRLEEPISNGDPAECFSAVADAICQVRNWVIMSQHSEFTRILGRIIEAADTH